MNADPPLGQLSPSAYQRDIPAPKYFRLKEIIREEYSSWNSGEPIPSEAELCQMYGVSRTTVRKALDDLTNEGLLYKIQGKGTFVSPRKLRERFVQFTAGFYEDMVARGIPVRTEVLNQAVIPADRQLAGQLQLALGEPVVRIDRVRSVNNQPVLVSESFVPRHLFPGIEYEDLKDVSLYGVLREKFGAKLARGTRVVAAVLCGEKHSRLLHVPIGSPLLTVSGLMHDTSGRPVECGTAWLRGDFSEIEIEIVTR